MTSDFDARSGTWGERVPEPDWDLYTPAELAEFWDRHVPEGETVTADRARELWAAEKDRKVARLEAIKAALMQERQRRLDAGRGQLTTPETSLAAELARQAAADGMTVTDPVLAVEIRESAWEYLRVEEQWPGWYDPQPDEAQLEVSDVWPDAASWAAAPAPAAESQGAAERQLNSYQFDVIAVTTVNVRAETEDRARAMIDGLNSITTRTTGHDMEAAYELEVSTSDYDVVNVSPRGRGYLVSAQTWGGEEISVSAPELIPDPASTAGHAGLREELAEADRALAGDSNDAEHDALHGLATAVRELLDESGYPRAGKPAPGKDGTADPAAGRITSPANWDEAERVRAPAGRTPAPRLADSSFPAHVQTGPPAAPPRPATSRARQHPSDQAQGGGDDVGGA